MEDPTARRRYERILGAIRKWSAAKKDGFECLGAVSRAKLQRAHLDRVTVASQLADLKLENAWVVAWRRDGRAAWPEP